MKKVLMLIAAIFAVSSIAVYAEYYSSNEKIEVQLENQTDFHTVSKSEAAFSVNFYIEERQAVQYDIEYTVNGKNFLSPVKIEPYKECKKIFHVDVPYGKNILTVAVKRDGETVTEFSKDLAVAEPYTSQFMDKYNKIGVCTHFGHQTSELATNSYNLEIFDYLQFAGINKIRDGFNPAYITQTKDKFDVFSNKTKWWMERFVNSNLELYQPIMANNPYGGYYIYPDDVETSGRTPRTPGAIASYGETMKAIMEQTPRTTMMDVWNEPNIDSQWKPQDGKSASDYTNLTKQTALTLYNANPDIKVNAFTCANIDTPWMTTGFEMGMYPYITGIDFHWYCMRAEPESDGYYNKIKTDVETVNVKYGGWLDKIASEMGAAVTADCTEEESAFRTFKEFMMLDDLNVQNAFVYDFVNDGTDAENKEHNFGTLTQDHYPKYNYLSLIRYNTELAGAIFVGKIDLGNENEYAYMYLKDGSPRLVAWMFSSDGTETKEFVADNITARDYYGNTICENSDSVNLTMIPYIIDGLGDEWLAKAVKSSLTDKHSEWLENYQTQLPQEIVEKAKTIFKEGEALYSEVPDWNTSVELFRKYFALGDDIIQSGKDKKIDELTVSQSLYQLYRMTIPQNSYCISQYTGAASCKADMAGTEQFIKSKYRNSAKTMQYSDKIYRVGKDYYTKATEVLKMEDNPAKAGVAVGYSLMADKLFGWVKGFGDYETVIEFGYTIQIPGYDLLGYVNQEKPIRMALRNQGKSDFSGTVKVYDEDGEQVYETAHINLRAGATLEYPFTLHLPEAKNDSNTLEYTYCLVNDSGKTVMSQKFTTSMQKSVDVKVMPSAVPPQELTSVKLQVSNNENIEKNFTLNLAGSDDLKLAQESMRISLQAKEQKVIEVPVQTVVNTKFHFYPLGYVAMDDTGAVIAKADTLLNFTCITKAEQEIDVSSFDGNIDSWYDAYPIYVNTPENATSGEAWQESDVAVRMFFKWDEEHLYVLADVYDDLHEQRFKGASIWQGDCIQLGIDPGNEKQAKYTENTYELGVAKGEFANDFWCWNGNADFNGFEQWTKIIRNDDAHNTRYLLAIPHSVISRLNLQAGNKFGFNFSVNDCDVLSRDLFIEYTPGLSSSKNPSRWEDFELLDSKNETFTEGRAGKTFN